MNLLRRCERISRETPNNHRKQLLIEGFFSRAELNAQTLREYFAFITGRRGLRTYADPIVDETSA